ncbi:hypothetical protein L6164_010976 [Bauhinia variegata]|uniref:Uncharacterized protein n=1 Tax=Bauhinia variegata TaxID=167791 RepID=A0ACB9P5A1_BAUVA|nr:hypothetical protein L6164_010976 [Bauhinia variegata]
MGHDPWIKSSGKATLMKLKLAAQGDPNVSPKEVDESTNDSTVTSSCLEVTDLEASASSSEPIISPNDEMVIDTDRSSISSSSPSSNGNQEQPRHKNVTILHFFSIFKDSKLSQSGSASVSSNYSETGSIQSSPAREF